MYDTLRQYLNFNWTDFRYLSWFSVMWASNLWCSTFGKRILPLKRSRLAVLCGAQYSWMWMTQYPYVKYCTSCHKLASAVCERVSLNLLEDDVIMSVFKWKLAQTWDSKCVGVLFRPQHRWCCVNLFYGHFWLVKCPKWSEMNVCHLNNFLQQSTLSCSYVVSIV